MTPQPRNHEALKKAHQLGFEQLEYLGFVAEAKKRAITVAMDEYAEAKRQREGMARLLRMMGADAPEIDEVTA